MYRILLFAYLGAFFIQVSAVKTTCCKGTDDDTCKETCTTTMNCVKVTGIDLDTKRLSTSRGCSYKRDKRGNMSGGAGLDNDWIWESLKFCGDGPLDMKPYFEGGCLDGLVYKDREGTQCCCHGDRCNSGNLHYGSVFVTIAAAVITKII